MKRMQDRVFLDTNILLYAFSTKDLQKQNIAKNILLSDAVISTQVINEVTVNLIKKFDFSEDNIQKFLSSSYSRYQVVDLNYELFSTASSLRKKYMFSYYDSVIVSAALISDCSTLYSEDMHHDLLIENRLRVVNPFK